MPQVEFFWLMAAKEKWLNHDVPVALAILQETYVVIPYSEEIWLATFKQKFETHKTDKVRMLLAKSVKEDGLREYG